MVEAVVTEKVEEINMRSFKPGSSQVIHGKGEMFDCFHDSEITSRPVFVKTPNHNWRLQVAP